MGHRLATLLQLLLFAVHEFGVGQLLILELQEVLCLASLFYLLSHALLFFLQVVIAHESLLVVAQLFSVLRNDIDHIQLEVLLVQQQVLMLRVHINQALPQLLEHRQRHRGVVDKRTALAC